jgi:MazG family protein
VNSSNPGSIQSPITGQFAKLCEIVAKLRAPGGCPWDREQTHESLLPQLIEEAYEVAGSIRTQDTANFREELGDLLLHVVMQAEIARESGAFDINDVLAEVSTKLIRRHPHVFGKPRLPDSGAVLRQWESIKQQEKNEVQSHFLDGVSKALPALIRAQKIQSKVARVHFDWGDVEDVIAKVDEELSETRAAIRSGDGIAITAEIGDLLFAVVNLARKCDLDAESVLQSATDKFVTRFNRVEEELQARGKQLGDAGLEELDAIWNDIKTKSER